MTDWAVKKLQGVLLDYVTIDCAGKQCFGFTAVHRVNFALGCFHAIHAILLLGCTWLTLQEGRRLKTERIGERDRQRRGEAAIVPGASTPSEAP